jgi:hypothetical protein
MYKYPGLKNSSRVSEAAHPQNNYAISTSLMLGFTGHWTLGILSKTIQRVEKLQVVGVKKIRSRSKCH